MSIRFDPKRNTWTVCVDLPRDPATGKRRQAFRRGLRTEVLARAEEASLRRQSDRERDGVACQNLVLCRCLEF